MRKVGVRYCGGCNPRHDRVALVKRLETENADCQFLRAEAGAAYDVILVVCGCPVACADREGLENPLIITGPEGFETAMTRLR